ncbi:glycoside hydrolase family 92 protein, partial [Phocaeicola vulgatus]|nr:glycoside hydrolase family 92 protein [Phocaeicola vulgatus]
MKINMLLSGCLLGLLCFTACDSEGNEMNDYTHYVNPFIGTGGHGHTHPGAMVPHGMIQPGPDTRIDGWDSCSGYYYEDTTINGFAHTRLSGTGCADFGDFLLMPTVGVQRTDFLGTESQKRPFASAFSHEKEYAEPGYYSVFLDTYGVKAELTSTERAAMHRYTFPESKESGFILDMDYNIQQQINQVMEVEAVNDTVLRGRKRSAYWAYRQDLYFYAVFSKPFTYTLYTDTVQENDKQIPVCKMLLHFETAKDEQVLAKFSISSVDAEGAYKNLQAEMPGWNFDGVRADAKKKWNECLSKIAVKTNDEDQRA